MKLYIEEQIDFSHVGVFYFCNIMNEDSVVMPFTICYGIQDITVYFEELACLLMN